MGPKEPAMELDSEIKRHQMLASTRVVHPASAWSSKRPLTFAERKRAVTSLHLFTHRPRCYALPSCFFSISPAGAGSGAPSGGLFLLLNSSHICSIVTHSTPSCLLMCSMILETPYIRTLIQGDACAGAIRSEGYLPLMHKKHMRPPTHIRMDRHRERELVILSVEVIEVIHPNLLDIPWIDETVAVRHLLHVHHWRQIIEVPIARYL